MEGGDRMEVDGNEIGNSNGIGVKMDKQKASIHFQKSVEMGNANGIGIEIENNKQKAFIYCQTSAEIDNSWNRFVELLSNLF
ncbi:hypothetical protein F8M41_007327 [Gigaspora margarita]|uniref:Uncharacterized protein n=1 Tax=Gigaspora margarita TaxID=4874 RepID=A0A8H3X581_GIGMA|nr:hypothetical protein F8M41_007327 [Gigaspora margarita]